MAFTIPNEADALHVHQSIVDKLDLDILAQHFEGNSCLTKDTGVIRGCDVSDKSGADDMSVDVAVGLVKVEGYYCYVAATNKAITAADTNKARIDIISVNYNGTLTVTDGTAAEQPVAPTLPSNSIVLATVYVSPGLTAIATANVTDKRIIIPDLYDSFAEFVSGSTEDGEVTEQGWLVSLTGTVTYATATGESGHPGVSTLAFNQVASSAIIRYYSTCITFGDVRRLTCIIKPGTTTANTAAPLKIAIDSDITTHSNNDHSIAFVYDVTTDPSWICHNGSGSGGNDVDSAVDINASNWYKLEMIQLQNGNWQFAINESLNTTASTQLPTASTACQVGIIGIESTASWTCSIDFLGLNIKPLTQRYT